MGRKIDIFESLLEKVDNGLGGEEDFLVETHVSMSEHEVEKVERIVR